ncbi:glycosyltransferase [Hahella sp. HN01]|uniref:glycosyltransferase n=1 Tax=Hahella sp. HN01 TaxID=2847262 RepID=UPI0020A63B97|nr:glycosyltransferase [Hahella sp. HN01]
MLKILFWVALFGAVYSYFLYPLILKLLPKRRMVRADGSAARKVSLIITAHNERDRIREKIENSLELDYPDMEIIVASDCSTDETDDIVREYADKGVRLARADERKGKEYAQLQAITIAVGEILVFSDVATKIPADAIKKLESYFADERVGAVSSEDRFITNDDQVAGEGAYVKYEMWLRRLESERFGLVGLSGSFFAARKKVCEEWDIYSPSDFNTALNCAKKDLVAVTAPDVLGFYKDVADPQKEYQRKVRTIIRGITALSRHPQVLSPVQFGWFAVQILSHKVMRWAVPWFLAALLVFSLLLNYQGGIYSLVLLGQIAFYLLVLTGHFKPDLREKVYVKIPYFFVQVNLAIAKATIDFFKGTRMTVWTPSKR